jgi:hypothetical protein
MKDNPDQQPDSKDKTEYNGAVLAISVALGLLFGMLLFQNHFFGGAMGALFGFFIGVVIEYQRHRK